MRKIFLTVLSLVIFLTLTDNTNACTSAIISGRVTPDGRPLLWKQRDTGADQNKVTYFNDGKYKYAGITSIAENPNAVWIGNNEMGFAIMNTLSYNILGDEAEETGRNGILMKEALSLCADVDEFEEYLKNLKKPYLVSANFGVIDAKGNAAYFEVNNETYYKFDVNDVQTAPMGYIARANFSFAGNTKTGVGYIRYTTADHMVKEGVLRGEISPEYIFENLSRSFYNPVLGIDLKSGDYNKPKTNGWFIEQDFIARRKSTCSVVIQGVKAQESPDLTTMWTIVSYPPTTVAVPVWVAGGKDGINPILTHEGKGNAYLANCGFTLKERAYTYAFETEATNKSTYFNWEILFNLDGTGYMQKVTSVEKFVLSGYHSVLDKWRKAGKIDVKELKSTNKHYAEVIQHFYADEFGL